MQVFNDSVMFPIMRDSDAFTGLLRTGTRTGEAEDKWTDRILENGAAIRLRSAEVNGSFRQIRARRVYISEAGDPVWMPGTEGDKIELAIKRTQNYPDGMFFMESSPTETDTCTITKWWNVSDQRKFLCPCPLCGRYQELKPVVGDKEGPGLKYVVDTDNRVIDQFYVCEHCAQPFYEKSKREIIDAGEWHATRVSEQRIAGFSSLGDPQLRRKVELAPDLREAPRTAA